MPILKWFSLLKDIAHNIVLIRPSVLFFLNITWLGNVIGELQLFKTKIWRYFRVIVIYHNWLSSCLSSLLKVMIKRNSLKMIKLSKTEINGCFWLINIIWQVFVCSFVPAQNIFISRTTQNLITTPIKIKCNVTPPAWNQLYPVPFCRFSFMCLLMLLMQFEHVSFLYIDY